jgi:hypothetical protein
MVCETLFTRAVTVALPGAPEVSVAEATPFVVVRIVVAVPVSRKVPRFVENSTAVPFGTAVPDCETVAVIVVVDLITGVEFDTARTIVAPVGGGVPLPPPPPGGAVGGGAVGDSPLQPPNRAIIATRAIPTTR